MNIVGEYHCGIQQYEEPEGFVDKLVILKYVGKKKVVEIPETLPLHMGGQGYRNVEVKVISERAFSETSVKKLVLPEPLELVKNGAFENSNIKELVVLGEHTYLESLINFDDNSKVVIKSSFGSKAELFAALKGMRFETINPNYHPMSSYFGFLNQELTFRLQTEVMIVPYMFEGKVTKTIAPRGFMNLGIHILCLPDTLVEIKESAFAENSLTQVIIPRSVKFLRQYAFKSNGSSNTESNSTLEMAVILGKNTVIEDGCFDGNPNLTIYGYKKSTAEKYAIEKGIKFQEL